MLVGTTMRNAGVDAMGALLNGGTLTFQTAAGNEVAICTLAATAFGAGSTGVATAAAIGSDTTTIAGTITKAIGKNSGGTEVCQFSVTATGGGGDITMPSTTYGAGETLGVTSLTVTVAAGTAP